MNSVTTVRDAPSRLLPPNNLIRPPLRKTLSEMRAVAEVGSFFAMRRTLKKRAPDGDGHPVMVIPGFMSGDGFTGLMRRFLDSLGYEPHPWGQGTNLGLRDQTCRDVEQKIAAIYRTTGRKVTLIGHSLGGVYARCVAHRKPEHVRQIITLGTPFNAAFEKQELDSKGGALSRAYERLNAGTKDDKLPNSTLMCFPPPLPSTSIYTEGDGIIGWEHCLDIADEYTENIRVPGSHTGMTYNPVVLHVIADRLGQAEREWQPFEPGGVPRVLLKSSCAVEVFPGWLLEQGHGWSKDLLAG